MQITRLSDEWERRRLADGKRNRPVPNTKALAGGSPMCESLSRAMVWLGFVPI